VRVKPVPVAVRLPISVVQDIVFTLRDSRRMRHLTGEQRANLDAVLEEVERLLNEDALNDPGCVEIEEPLVFEILRLFRISQDLFREFTAAFGSSTGA